MKLTAGLINGSVSIISEAIHSMIDLIAAIITFFSVKISDAPPDDRHPYGYGKFENVSGVIEALLIFIAAIWIVYEAVKKIIHQEPIESVTLGIIVMSISAVVNYVVSSKLYSVSKETDSIALEADGLHLKTDVMTSIGVGVALVLIWITGCHIIDPVAAIIVAILILKESWDLFKRAYSPLLDTSLSDEEIQCITDIVIQHNLEFHNLRTRKAGKYRFAELHLEMPGTKQLNEVHEICDRIENCIKSHLKNIEISIHAEPKKENRNKKQENS